MPTSCLTHHNTSLVLSPLLIKVFFAFNPLTHASPNFEITYLHSPDIHYIYSTRLCPSQVSTSFSPNASQTPPYETGKYEGKKILKPFQTPRTKNFWHCPTNSSLTVKTTTINPSYNNIILPLPVLSVQRFLLTQKNYMTITPLISIDHTKVIPTVTVVPFINSIFQIRKKGNRVMTLTRVFVELPIRIIPNLAT